MSFLSVLSRLGVSFAAPRWLISLALLPQAGLRGADVGVRVVVFGANGDVFLVRHSYVKGWYLPGGGVDRWELPVEAARRELREEAGMIARSEPELVGIFLNDRLVVPSYVLCYRVHEWDWESEQSSRPDGVSPDGEIVEAGFFSPDALPEGVTAATRARIAEVTSGSKPSRLW